MSYPPERDVHRTGKFTRFDDPYEEVREDPRVPGHGIRQRPSSFDVLFDRLQDFLERSLLFLLEENIQTLHDGNARIDERRELPSEDDHLFELHRIAESQLAPVELKRGLGQSELCRANLHGAKAHPRLYFVDGLDEALH